MSKKRDEMIKGYKQDYNALENPTPTARLGEMPAALAERMERVMEQYASKPEASGPRPFWVDCDDGEGCEVIEKSAYDALKWEYEATDKVYRMNRDAIEKLKAERDELQRQWQHEHTRKVDLDHERDQLQRELGTWKAQAKFESDHRERYMRERDEARAEVESLRNSIRGALQGILRAQRTEGQFDVNALVKHLCEALAKGEG